MVKFERINETGSIRYLGENPVSFEFHYNSRFYGECYFEARVRVETNHGLVICPDSIQIVNQKVNRGTAENLISGAHLFFTRVIKGYSRQRLCQESRGDDDKSSSLAGRLWPGVLHWREQFLSPIHSLSLSQPIEIKNKHNSD